MISVLIVNGQLLVRQALWRLVAAEPGLSVVGDTASVVQAVDMSRVLHPDVVLLDADGTSPGSIAAIETITGAAQREAQHGGQSERQEMASWRQRVLVLVHPDQREVAHAALRAGADGCLPFDVRHDALVAAIHHVAAGAAVLTPELTLTLIDLVRAQHVHDRMRARAWLDDLTHREREVLDAIASGSSNAEIAERLVLSESTVKGHVSQVFAKLRVRSRVEAVALAYESGLVQPAT